jgi:hypothetical protein
VRNRIQVILVLAAWFLATGSQWDFAQLFAWGRMFAGYSQEMSVGAAVQKTFSGETCAICRAVQKAKRTQEQNGAKTPAAKFAGKLLDLFPVTIGTRVSAPPATRQEFCEIERVMRGQGRASPPLPPPRGQA